MSFVIDASVAIRWFVEEEKHENAEAILEELRLLERVEPGRRMDWWLDQRQAACDCQIAALVPPSVPTATNPVDPAATSSMDTSRPAWLPKSASVPRCPPPKKVY